MSRVLITGMSAPQYSEALNVKTLSFAGLLRSVLEQQGHTVTQKAPDMQWLARDLTKYDAVLVGISPLTSLSSNYVYGALNVMRLLKDTNKLRFFIDAPEPSRVFASLRAIDKRPEDLVKPFFSYRRGYDIASRKEIFSTLFSITQELLNRSWEPTLYPALPWDGYQLSVKDFFPKHSSKSLVPMNLDSFILKDERFKRQEPSLKWVCDNLDTRWSRQTIASVSTATSVMQWNKGWDDEKVLLNIGGAIGSMITPNPSGTWWTNRLVQSLNIGTPVVTDWPESGVLGSEWSYLASTIDDMSHRERSLVADLQTATYSKVIPSKEEAIKRLEKVLGL